MSLKQELETHARAVASFDRGEYGEAYREFESIAESSSKIRFNMGIVLATLGQHEDAIVQYQAALRMDRYLAVAYFQAGVSSFLLGNFEEAHGHFDDAYLYLRGNQQIDYAQLGLNFKLFSCEVLYNRGLCTISQGNSAGVHDLGLARLEKQIAEHNIIDQALQSRGVGYTIFSAPAGILYRPDEAKLRNVAVKDYLGKARLIASIDASDVSTGFRGYQSTTAAPRTLSIAASEATSSDVNSLLSRFTFGSRSASVPRIDRHLDHARELEFSRLDEALVRKASSASGREKFPLPIRSRSLFKRIRDLPPTPPRTESRSSSRKSSIASSTLSERQASPASGVQGLFQNPTMTSFGSVYKPLPRPIDMEARRHPPSPRSQSPERSGTTQNFSQQLASLELNLPRTISRNTKPSRKSSQSSSLSENALRVEADDYERDLIDDYYSSPPSFSGTSGDGRNANMSISRIKVRVYGAEDTRVITVHATVTLAELHARLKEKFAWHTIPKLRTKDEDDEMILLQDQEDLSICLETAILDAQRACKDVGRLEIWVKV